MSKPFPIPFPGGDRSDPQTSGLQIPLFEPSDALVSADVQALLSQLGQPSTDGGIGAASSFDPAARFPAKIVARIEALEFVEISELLQESWSVDGTESNLKTHGRRAPVTDILVWAECFSGMAAVLARRHPQKAPELFAYMRRIMNAARKYEGAAWVTYDRVYRRQAASRRTLNWSQEDQALYNEVFAGRAKQCPRCRYCLSEHHSTETCPDTPTFPFAFPLAPTTTVPNANPLAQARLPPPVRSGEICRKYNENRCFFRQCKHTHACSICYGTHPAEVCTHNRRGDPYPRRDPKPATPA